MFTKGEHSFFHQECSTKVNILFFPWIFSYELIVDKTFLSVSEKIFCNAHEALHAIHQVVPA